MSICKKIPTDDPIKEQWKLLSRYSFPANIKRYFENKGYSYNDSIIQLISASLIQAESYFQISRNASLYIKPVLVYYGTINLMLGATTLLNGEKLEIKGHGVYCNLDSSNPDRLGDSTLIINNKKHSGFYEFQCSFFKGDDKLSGTKWTLSDIFSNVPDLKSDFEICYPDLAPSVVPVEVVQLKNKTIERIYNSDMEMFSSFQDVFSKIPHFKEYYMEPQLLEDKIILNRKLINFKDIGIYSIYGRKYFQLFHDKNGKNIILEPLMNIYCGLFALSHLARYYPEIWNPSLQNDITGEKLIIEKFIDVSIRLVPNFILNYLENTNISFVNETEGYSDLRFATLESDVKEMVENKFEDLLDSERLKKK